MNFFSGKVVCSPLKVPTPPNSSLSLKRSSLNSLAHYLSSIGTITPPQATSVPSPVLPNKRPRPSPSPNRMLMSNTPSTLASSCSPHYSSSSSGEEHQSVSGADSDNEGLVIEENNTEEQPSRYT